MGYKFLMGVLVFCGLIFAQNSNTNGWLDTAVITAFHGTDLKYTKFFPLSRYQDIRVIVKAKDTANHGAISSDAVDFGWGWQTACQCLNRSGTVDTCFDSLVAADTILGSADNGTDLTGFLYRSKEIKPGFDQFIRFFVQGIVGTNQQTTYVVVNFQVLRKIYTPIRSQ